MSKVSRPILILSLLLVCFICVCGYFWYSLIKERAESVVRSTEFTETISDREHTINELTVRINEFDASLKETTDLLLEITNERDELAYDLRQEKDRNENFEEQINEIGSTVGNLDKLSKLDKELLMKYSKVYFLNEHYTPSRLVQIDKDFLAIPSEPKFIHASVRPFLNDMIDDAHDDKIELRVVSAFRSFDEQRALKGGYAITYGSGANAFSADQGYSEHQIGTTVDFTTDALNGAIDGFDQTEAYAWLTNNAHKYGFVLSYPKNNSYYVFEPWHWRFVGEDLARDLHADEKYFYDLEQREIDTYLLSIFD